MNHDGNNSPGSYIPIAESLTQAIVTLHIVHPPSFATRNDSATVVNPINCDRFPCSCTHSPYTSKVIGVEVENFKHLAPWDPSYVVIQGTPSLRYLTCTLNWMTFSHPRIVDERKTHRNLWLSR